jgi:hypothetical protein
MDEPQIDWRTELHVPDDWKGTDITKNRLAHAYKRALDAMCTAMMPGEAGLACKQRLQKAFLVAWMEFETNGGNGTF